MVKSFYSSMKSLHAFRTPLYEMSLYQYRPLTSESVSGTDREVIETLAVDMNKSNKS